MPKALRMSELFARGATIALGALALAQVSGASAQMQAPPEAAQTTNSLPQPVVGEGFVVGHGVEQCVTNGAGPGAGHNDTPGNINNDSSYATGEDLKGAPAQFPANKTPE